MNTLRIVAIALVASVASVSSATVASHARQAPTSAALAARGATAATVGSVHDFDFLVGEWRVHHRRLRPGSQEWVEFDGTCGNRLLIGGSANVEEHAMAAPAGAYRAIGLRAYDATRGEWAIWWLDGRYPAGPLDPPVKGRFENGVGRFYGDYTQDGKPMRVRFLWSEITPTSARWEQSSSADGGKTWASNWIMTFQRDTQKHMAATAKPAAAAAAAVHDFD